MTEPARLPGTQRFVAYSTLTRLPVLAGADAAALLAETRAIPALGYDNRFVEVLDCGADGPDAGAITAPLEATRALYRTVFRGSGALSRPGMPPFPLRDGTSEAEARSMSRAIAHDLAGLADRARTAGLSGLAAAIDRAGDVARAEGDPRSGEG